MPKLALFKNFVIFLFAYDLKERTHVHIARDKGDRTHVAKIWLDTLEVHDSANFSEKELNQVIKALETNKYKIIGLIEVFRATGKVKAIQLK